MDLNALLASTAEQMRLEVEIIRLAAQHQGLKGTAAEEMVAEFLAKRLPTSLGVTTGKVVDSYGGISKQIDVIVYDTRRTPMLFTSPGKSWHVVPVEGVLAVIEVKMRLTAAMIPGILENCASVLDLQRDAYIGKSAPHFEAHGRKYSELPICFHVFAFESDNMYGERFNEKQASLDLAFRVTSVCYLDRGVNLYFEMDGPKVAYREVATAPGLLSDVHTTAALLVWFTVMTTVIFQAELRPIDLARYAKNHLSDLSGTLGQQPAAERAKALADLADQVLSPLGVPSGVGAKIFIHQTGLNQDEIDAILNAGGTYVVGSDGRPAITLPT